MTCPRCQTINPEGAMTCASCGSPLMMGAPMGPAGAPGYPPPQGMYPPPSPYGQPPPYGQPYMMMQGQPTSSGMAIAGFVLSFLCPLLGLIFSIIGMNEVKNSNGMKTGGGLALAGLIISICFIGLGILVSAAGNH